MGGRHASHDMGERHASHGERHLPMGERQTEDLKVPGSIPGFGNMFIFFHHAQTFVIQVLRQLVGQETEKTNTSDALLH